MGLINLAHLNLIRVAPYVLCYAQCPKWHGCDCPRFSHR